MVNWKEQIKGLGVSAGKGIVRGVSTIASAAQKKVRNAQRKSQILDRMYPGVIRKLAYDKGLKPQAISGGRPTIDDYKRSVILNVPLEELIEFANKKGVPIRDITVKIDREVAELEVKELSKHANISDEFKEVIKSIMDFQPLKNYRSEYPYQAELTQWLRSRFPKTNIEVQRGSSRPDIAISGIAIEIKGPTEYKDLDTIASKCMRYSKYFKRGIIIVLFTVRVKRDYYQEWVERIKETHRHLAHIEIIRK